VPEWGRRTPPLASEGAGCVEKTDGRRGGELSPAHGAAERSQGRAALLDPWGRRGEEDAMAVAAVKNGDADRAWCAGAGRVCGATWATWSVRADGRPNNIIIVFFPEVSG
jgi:hypothetical protein